MKTMISSALLALAGGFSQAQMNPVEMQIGAVFIEQVVGVQGEVCPARNPGSKQAWAGAVQDWKARNREELAGMQRLAEQLQAHDPGFTVAAQAHLASMVLFRLASLNDSDAARTCDEFLKNLSSPKADEQVFATAKAATAAVLARKGAPR